MKKVRIIYEKSGRMVYISHLDMNRFMIRAVRLAKLPIWYTEGFNPHPYITFAQPLSLGFASETEIMDMRLEDDNISNEEIKSSLEKFMPIGIKIIRVIENVRDPKEICFSRYRIELALCENKLEEIKKLLSSDSITVKKRTKKGETDFDIKPHIINLESSYKDNYLILEVTLTSSVLYAVNPKLIISAIENYLSVYPDDILITRLALFDKDQMPFLEDLDNG